MLRIGVTIIVGCLSLAICFWCGMEYNDGDHASWSRGYSDCMEEVVKALASHDEVRLGNLIITEPNTAVSDMTFFVVDPNQWAMVIDAVNGSVQDCYFNCIGQNSGAMTNIPLPGFLSELNSDFNEPKEK